MIYKYFLAVLTVFFLSGCGGGGEDLSANMDGSADGSSGGTTTNQSAEGLWSGDLVSSSGKKMQSIGVILSNKEYFFATGDNYTSLIVGSGTTTGNNFQSSTLFNTDGKLGFNTGSVSGTINGTVSGSIFTAESLVTSFVSKSDANKRAYGTLTYDPTFNTQPNLSSLDNTKFSFSNLLTNLKVANNKATFSFVDEDCDYSGELQVDSNIRNYFLLTMKITQRSGKTCQKITDEKDPIVGVAIYTNLDSTETLFFMGINSLQDRWFVAPFKKM